jgi:hypothetical protein
VKAYRGVATSDTIPLTTEVGLGEVVAWMEGLPSQATEAMGSNQRPYRLCYHRHGDIAFWVRVTGTSPDQHKADILEP